MTKNESSAAKWRRLRRFIWHRDGKRCALCGKVIRLLTDMHMDHVIQKHDGGATTPENLRAAHAWCNRHRPKGRYNVIDWSQHPDRLAQKARKEARTARRAQERSR